MRTLLLMLMLACTAPLFARDMIIVVGAEGEPLYAPIFRKQADAWAAAGKKAGFHVRTIGLDAKESPRAALQGALEALPKDGDDFWLVLIGHGSFDGRSAKFNLRGDDVSASELGDWLDAFRRPLVAWNLFSASGAFLPELARANRVVAAATRSGSERNYSRFGAQLAETLGSKDADLDGDGTVSIVELFATATSRTGKSYENDQRLLSEHAILDDNGDGSGTQAEALLHPKPNPTRPPDGLLAATTSLTRDNSTPTLNAEQTRQRNELEAQIAELRTHKEAMQPVFYYQRLEALLLQLARLYESARNR
jgi:hypothetical protein